MADINIEPRRRSAIPLIVLVILIALLVWALMSRNRGEAVTDVPGIDESSTPGEQATPGNPPAQH